MAKTLIFLGIVLIAAGVCWQFGERLGLGQLPGDIIVKNEKFSFYFPLASCILLSLSASAVLWLVNYIKK